MRKPKKTKKPKKLQDPATADSGAQTGQKSGKFGKLLLPIVLGITSFCTVYFLPRTEIVSAPDNAAGEAARTNTSQAHTAGEAEAAPIETGFVTIEPFTVSLKGRTRLLRLSITIESPLDMMDLIDPNDPKLRDAFMGYLSALGMEQVEDAAFLVRLRAQLTRRAQFVLGADHVHNILITDFMVR